MGGEATTTTMTDVTGIADRLRELADELDGESDGPNWDNPWTWHDDHTRLERNAVGSGYDIGISEAGQVLIHRRGHVGCISHDTIENIVEPWRSELRR